MIRVLARVLAIFFTGLAVVVGVGLLIALVPTSPPNTNPRTGWVEIDVGDRNIGRKICDHSTLIYQMWNGSGGPIPNSPECS